LALARGIIAERLYFSRIQPRGEVTVKDLQSGEVTAAIYRSEK